MGRPFGKQRPITVVHRHAVPVEKFIEIGPWPNSSSCLGNGGIIFRGGEPITRRADRSRNLQSLILELGGNIRHALKRD